MVRRHHAIEGKLRDVGDWFQDVKFQGGYTNYTHTEYSSVSGAGPVFNYSGMDSRIEARQRSISLGNGLQLEGMLGFQREKNNLGASGDERFIPSSRTHSTALFTYQALKTSWGQWSAGARTERVSVQSLEDIASDTTTISAQTKTFNPVSFALGVMRNLRTGEMQEGWQITSNLSASQRAPKDYELFANGAHAATGSFEVGSPNNTLEKATQLDVGGEWKKGVHKFGLTAFTSNFSNYISLQASGSAPYVDEGKTYPIYNFQGVRARFMGLESHAKLRMVGGQQALLSNDAQHGAVDLELRGDMVRADDLTNGRPMPRIAPMRLGADALWSKNAWGARFGFMHAGAQNRMPYITGVTTVPTAAYTMWNAGLNYRAHSGQTNWMFFAKLDNLTNKLAYSSTSSLTQTMSSSLAPPLAGRSLKLGLQASF